MRVKCKIDCVGLGYNLKVDEEVELDNELAEKLIKFDYVEEIKSPKKKGE